MQRNQGLILQLDDIALSDLNAILTRYDICVAEQKNKESFADCQNALKELERVLREEQQKLLLQENGVGENSADRQLQQPLLQASWQLYYHSLQAATEIMTDNYEILAEKKEQTKITDQLTLLKEIANFTKEALQGNDSVTVGESTKTYAALQTRINKIASSVEKKEIWFGIAALLGVILTLIGGCALIASVATVALPPVSLGLFAGGVGCIAVGIPLAKKASYVSNKAEKPLGHLVSIQSQLERISFFKHKKMTQAETNKVGAQSSKNDTGEDLSYHL